MGHRTQITLEDEQYERLQRVSQETGRGLAELIRRAVDQTYASSSTSEFAQRIDLSFGAWETRLEGADSEPDGAAYVDSIRIARPDRFAER